MRWHKVYTIARHEYLVTVRRLGFIVLTALVPVLGLILLLIAGIASRGVFSQAAQLLESLNKPIGVVDYSGYFSPLLPAFEDDFRLYADEEAAYREADQGELMAVIVIPKDYITTGRVAFYAAGGSFVQATLMDSHRLRAFLAAHLSRQYVPDEILQRLSRPLVQLVPVEESVSEASPLTSVLKFAIPYVLAILLIISIFASSGYLLQGLAEEKENRLVEIVLSSVTPMEWFTGKVLGLGAVGLTQVLIWILSAVALSGGSALVLAITMPTFAWHVWVLLLLFYALGYALYAVLQAGIGSLGTTMREVQQLAGIISLIPLLPLTLSGVFFAAPSSAVVRVLSLVPLTAPTMMMMRLPLMEVPGWEILTSLLLLGASIPAAAWLGARLFRMGILIYGKRPTLQEVWRALRAA